LSEIVWVKISAKGGHPTGTTAFATGCRISETASPRPPHRAGRSATRARPRQRHSRV